MKELERKVQKIELKKINGLDTKDDDLDLLECFCEVFADEIANEPDKYKDTTDEYKLSELLRLLEKNKLTEEESTDLAGLFGSFGAICMNLCEADSDIWKTDFIPIEDDEIDIIMNKVSHTKETVKEYVKKTLQLYNELTNSKIYLLREAKRQKYHDLLLNMDIADFIYKELIMEY